MNVNFKQLETFVLVADLGSFRKVAARLNTTQPNISARIAALENSLDIVLMERDAGSVRLTARGEKLLDYARRVMQSVDDFVVASDNTNLFDGVLRLGVTEMIVSTWLGEFLKQFKEHYPKTSIELTVDLSSTLEQALADNDIDIAFQSGPFSRSASASFDLGSFPMVWVAPPELELAVDKKITLDKLTQFPIITHARNTRSYLEIVEHLEKRSDLRARLVPSSNLSAGIQMAIDGYGVGAMLQPMVESELKAGQLVLVNYPWTPKRLAFYARYNKDRSHTVIIEAAELASKISNHLASKYV